MNPKDFRGDNPRGVQRDIQRGVHVQRDVQGGVRRDVRPTNNRPFGEAPSIGKVARLRDPDLVSEKIEAGVPFSVAAKYDDGASAAIRALVLRWSIGLGVATVLAIAAAVSLWVLPYMNRQKGTSAANVDHDARVRIVSRFTAPGEDEAIWLVKRAMANRDPAKVGALFEIGSANPEEIIEFFKNSDTRDGAVTRCSWLSSIDGGGSVQIEGVQVSYAGVGKPTQRLALLTPDDRGVWKMDFDAFARSVRPSWRELLEEHAESAVVRVYVDRDAYFNGPFRDEKIWRCFGMASPDIEDQLRGYCKIGSEQESAMRQIFADGARMGRATLEIHRVEGAEAKQFEITRVLARDWVVREKNPIAEMPATY